MQPIADLFAMNGKNLEALAKPIPTDRWLERLGDANHTYWIVGHVVRYRSMLASMLDPTHTLPDWTEPFEPRRDAPIPSSIDTDPQTMFDLNRAAIAVIADKLPKLTPEQCEADAGRTMPDGSTTFAGMVRFLFWHDSFHLGQLSMINRAFGYTSLGR